MTAQDRVPLVRAGHGHADGSTGLCAMQVVSWQHGDETVTDHPDYVDRALARAVQNTNDTMCARRDGRLLCPECSMAVLALADRTVNTRLAGWSGREAALAHARLAVEQAEQVAHLASDQRATWAVSAAWECVQHPDVASTRDAALAAADAAVLVACSARTDAAANAANAASMAAHAAAAVVVVDHDPATRDAVMSAAGGAIARALDAGQTTAPGRCGCTDAAHRVIDRFQELTGLGQLDPLATDATPALA